MILIDTSVWIDFLKKKPTPQVQRLRELLSQQQAAITPVIYQEILQGAKSPDDFLRLRDYFRSLPFFLPLDYVGIYEDAGELYSRCR